VALAAHKVIRKEGKKEAGKHTETYEIPNRRSTKREKTAVSGKLSRKYKLRTTANLPLNTESHFRIRI
jgi:hypothetical protein